jgi:UDP-N-acetylmuramoylalanine--D-glutamate ligase
MADEIAEAVVAQPGGTDMLIERTASVADAVAAAGGLSRPGDVILLSPSGTSFDAFRDYEERGDRFRQLVEELS